MWLEVVQEVVKFADNEGTLPLHEKNACVRSMMYGSETWGGGYM